MSKYGIERQVYRFIRDYISTHGYPPNITETAEGCALPTTAVVRQLHKLESQGQIIRIPRKERGVRLIEPILDARF